MPKKPKLSEQQKIYNRAAKKAEAIAEKATKDIPLFADQVTDLPTAAELYHEARLSWARSPRGEEAAYLYGIDKKWDIYILRRLARSVMSPEDFAIAVSRDRDFGETIMFWKNILTGSHRLVLKYEKTVFGWKPCFDNRDAKVCCEHGCRRCESKIICYLEHSTLPEALVWPPEGWKPPLTKEELDTFIAVPIPQEHVGAVDPLNLRQA